ncbi:MAG: FMN-dependent oxidoreductase (nitrilotriacetate monooxygenase family) [Alphaproteobacteria bacterium]|jgi:FMN-dependent oxidoreductase (nitrilotriacetate monooxygenase family)
MAKNPKKIHLAQFLVHGPTFHSHAMWRHPKTAAAGFDWRRPDLYEHIARTCERGKFDMIFFADLNYISDSFRHALDPALKYASQAPEHDPLPLLSWLGAVTKRIGLAATFSASNVHPFHAARMWATIDHLTSGRAGWNVVSSINHNQAANYGAEREPSERRYERAHEYFEVCKQLWASWEEDALVMDREAPLFADPAKVHRIDFEGEFFRSRGPLNVTPSPQNGPVIMQAGTSPKGRDFAAQHAEGIFAIQPQREEAKKYRDDIRNRVAELGRDPDDCKFLFGAQVILGSSEQEARDKQAEHNALVEPEAGMTILSAHLDFDLSQLPPGSIMETHQHPQLQRMKTRYRTDEGRPLTVAEVAQNHGQSVGLPQFVGTPVSVTDQLLDFIDHVGGDGFMLSPIYSPGAINEFVELVVPELQKRGRFRKRYSGKMLRDHLQG